MESESASFRETALDVWLESVNFVLRLDFCLKERRVYGRHAMKNYSTDLEMRAQRVLVLTVPHQAERYRLPVNLLKMASTVLAS